ncbi:hypothetical protein M434DRAFT_28132 [Hypoxylon sp. CO27-5]|nr:hypothetical protein M434DRAFT_28132 [Hypoxylon sp. CO27-5]
MEGSHVSYQTYGSPITQHASENDGHISEHGFPTNQQTTFEGMEGEIGEQGWGNPKVTSARVSQDAVNEPEDEDVLDSIEESESGISETSSLISELLVKNPVELLNRYKNILMANTVTRDSPIKDETSSVKESPSIQDAPSTTSEKDTDHDDEDGWRYEQIFINQILKGRGEYSLMPTTWKLHFRGIPLPERLFYTQTRAVSARPRIYGRTQSLEYRGAIALRRLFDLHSLIRDIRKTGKRTGGNHTKKILQMTRRRITDAHRWAQLDGDIAKYERTPVPSNVKIVEIRDADRQDMDVHIQNEMKDLAEEWRELLVRIPEQDRPKAPVLFGFVIFQHILFIVTLDAEDPDAVCHIPCQLNLSERNQHQWNAMAIMVTICWARDLFEALSHKIPRIDIVEQSQDSDPDA